MQPLIVSDCQWAAFKIPFLKPFTFAGTTLEERRGFYLTLTTMDGLSVQGEIAPLEGLSPESPRRVRHELEEIRSFLMELKIPRDKDALLELLHGEAHLVNVCASVRFGVEAVLLMLASKAAGVSLAEFLGGQLKDVRSALLLQGSHADVIADVKKFVQQGAKVFKLKVGDRNVALDVKKVQDIRMLLDEESYLRLDANGAWTLKEACIFGELAGNQKIDFIEEPANDAATFEVFYQKTRMRVALDESIKNLRCGVQAPGRCSPPLAQQEGVVAYVLKPMLLGLVPCLDWIAEAGSTNRKAIISSSFETPVGFKILANLAALSGQVAGLGTERWFKNDQLMAGPDGMIKKEFLL